MLAKCDLTILELNWNQDIRVKKIKLNIYHHTLTSHPQLQNRSFHVVERTRTSAKCKKMKIACAKRIYCFLLSNMHIYDLLCAVVVVVA